MSVVLCLSLCVANKIISPHLIISTREMCYTLRMGLGWITTCELHIIRSQLSDRTEVWSRIKMRMISCGEKKMVWHFKKTNINSLR